MGLSATHTQTHIHNFFPTVTLNCRLHSIVIRGEVMLSPLPAGVLGLFGVSVCSVYIYSMCAHVLIWVCLSVTFE